MKKMVLPLLLLGCLSCSSMSQADKDFGPLKTVDYVDIQKFMGPWYVIANIPTFIEKGATNAVETYTWNEKEKRIDVMFKFNADKPNGKLKEYPQKAFIYNKKTNAEWRIQFIWPLKFAYLVIGLDPEYRYTVIGVPDRKNVWIMARTPQMDEALLTKLIGGLQAVGYDTSKIERVPQVW